MTEWLRSDSFHLEIDGLSAASFSRCSGLGAEREVFEYTEGGATVSAKFPGDRVYSNIVLERGLVGNSDLYDWFVSGEPRDGAVVLLSPSGREHMRWEFQAAWPCRWHGPALDAAQPAVAVELVELVHEGLKCQPR